MLSSTGPRSLKKTSEVRGSMTEEYKLKGVATNSRIEERHCLKKMGSHTLSVYQQTLEDVLLGAVPSN